MMYRHFDNIQRVAATPRLDIQVQARIILIKATLQKTSKGSVAFAFDADENGRSERNLRTARHLSLSTDLRDAAEHAGTVLGIQRNVPTQAAHVLGAVDASGAVFPLLDDKKLLFLQVVEQAHVV